MARSGRGTGPSFAVSGDARSAVSASRARRKQGPAGSGVRTVTVDPDGYVVMVTPGADQQALLVVATADSIRASTIGERGWFES